jgi:hypothetical protein
MTRIRELRLHHKTRPLGSPHPNRRKHGRRTQQGQEMHSDCIAVVHADGKSDFWSRFVPVGSLSVRKHLWLILTLLRGWANAFPAGARIRCERASNCTLAMRFPAAVDAARSWAHLQSTEESKRAKHAGNTTGCDKVSVSILHHKYLLFSGRGILDHPCRLPPHSFPFLPVSPRLFAMASCTSRLRTSHWILKPIRIHVLHRRSNQSTSRQQQKPCWFPGSTSPGNISCECTSRRTCSPAALASHLLLTTEPHLRERRRAGRWGRRRAVRCGLAGFAQPISND